MRSEVVRLRQQAESVPTVRNWLALANALFGSEDLREMSEALACYRKADRCMQAARAASTEILGPDGEPFAAADISERAWPISQVVRVKQLMRRIRERLGRGLDQRLPGMHRPMDADRKFRPRGVKAEDWDALGTRAESESWPEAPVPSREASEAASRVGTGLGPLGPVPGEPDEEGVFDGAHDTRS